MARFYVYFWIVFGLICGNISTAIAQTDTAKVLAAVVIRGIPLQKFAVGSKVITFDSLAQATQNTQSLSELLLAQSPAYIKQYGNGMLGSISLRGTGAGHTAVLWNGVQLNSFTLGEADFSNIPVFGNPQIALQTGSAGSLYGSGAVGGTVQLYSQPAWEQDFQVQVQQNVGSFGNFFSGINVKWSNARIESKITLYRQTVVNDFPISYLLPNGDKVKQRQQNASFRTQGIQSEVHLRLQSNQYLSLRAWYHDRDTEHQPTLRANLQSENYAQAQEQSLRLLGEYGIHSAWGYLQAKVSYVYDNYLYQKTDKTATQRLLGILQYEKRINPKLHLQAGANSTYIFTNVDNYANNPSEVRTELFAGVRYQILPFGLLSLNARQTLAAGYAVPFTPSLGSEWQIFRTTKQQFIVKTSLARSYRLPTLNERYWNPGGNINLRPENGWSAEGGLQYQHTKPRAQWEADLTFYKMWVEDWVVWQPGTVWTPANIRQVHTQGIEAQTKFKQQITKGLISVGTQYAFTQSIIKADAETQTLGNQLAYVPLHRLSFFANGLWQGYFAQINYHFTSYRYTSLSNADFLGGFGLLNLTVGKDWTWAKHQIGLQFQVNNLLNAHYQNYENRAMPDRNYQITIRYHFQNPKAP
jgi:iron complex outermembrane receptor protein